MIQRHRLPVAEAAIADHADVTIDGRDFHFDGTSAVFYFVPPSLLPLTFGKKKEAEEKGVWRVVPRS